MTPLNRFPVRHAALAAALWLAAGCGSSDGSSSSASEPEATPATAAAPTEAETGPAATVGETEPAPEPESAPAGATEVSIVLNDGRSWTLDAEMCSFDPGATGPAAAVLNIGAANADGAELGVLDAWPFDGTTENGTVFFGNFADENEELFIFVNGSSTMVGDAVEVTADY